MDRRPDRGGGLTAAPRRADRMRMSIEHHLIDSGIVLPEPAAPVASYVPVVVHDGLAHVSGQIPFNAEGALMLGRMGEHVDLAFGARAAERCALMILAQLKAALGSLDRVERIVKLGVFVASTPDFTDQPKVANGASDLMVRVFGDAGKHARSAVGVPTLPLGVVVEVDAIVAIQRLILWPCSRKGPAEPLSCRS